jgi:dsRNA-specific ribonuclease
MTAAVRGSDRDEELTDLERRIGHDFADRSLLRRALAHRSWCAETPGAQSNERLEFLGDAVLGWVVADLSYREFDQLACRTRSTAWTNSITRRSSKS